MSYPPQGQAAGGGISLDTNDFLPIENVYPCGNEYLNHNGDTGNFMETGTTGNATATETAASHSMVLVSGITLVGLARYNSKSTITLSTVPVIINAKLSRIVSGAGGNRDTYIGLGSDWTDTFMNNCATFRQNLDGNWYCVTGNANSWTNTAIAAITTSKLMTIVATSTSVRFFVDRVLVATHTTTIPSIPLKLGAVALCRGSAATTSREAGIDLIHIK